MNVLTFWLSILAFTALFGTFILSFIAQKEHHESFRSQYLWYVAISWLWFVFQFIGFVHTTFLDRPNLYLLSIIGIMRAIISVLVTYRIITLLGSIEQGDVPKNFHRYGLIASVLVVLFLSAIIVLDILPFGPLFTATVNTAIGGAFLVFRLRTREQQTYRAQRMGSFLTISAVAYLLFGLYAVLFFLFPRQYRPVYDAFSTALFILVWCVNDVAMYIREMSKSRVDVIEDDWDTFCDSFRITPREKDIVIHLVKGLSYKEIADVLCISPRTVETHAYRIFKKCSVSNKIELTNKIRKIRTPT